MKDVQQLFIHFAFSNYFYDHMNSDLLWSLMSEKEREMFRFNVRLVDWKPTLQGFAYGIKRFYLHEDCLSPDQAY